MSAIQLQKQSIYELLGGEPSIIAAVNIFYDKYILQDARVNIFFQNVDMERQKEKQIKFLTQALGGPEIYDGLDMKQAHKHLRLNEENFNIIVGHLVQTLLDLSVPEEIINQIGGLLIPLKDQIINGNKEEDEQQSDD